MNKKAVASVLGVPMFVVAGFLIWMPSDLLFESLTETPINVWGSLVPHVFLALVVWFAAYVTGAAGILMPTVIRYAGWLDGLCWVNVRTQAAPRHV